MISRVTTHWGLVAFLLALTCALVAHAAAAEPDASETATDEAEAGAPAVDDDPRRKARRRAIERTTLTEKEELLIRRPDRERPEHPLAIQLFNRPLTIGGRLSLTGRYDERRLLDYDDLDYDGKDIDGDGNTIEVEDSARGQVPTDDQWRLSESLQLDLFYPINENAAVYAEGVVSQRNRWAHHEDEDHQWVVRRGETWIYLGEILGSPFGLQAGRQRFFDEREWWWDEDLDSVRLRADFSRLHVEFAIAQELFADDLSKSRVDRDREDILQGFAIINWEWADRQRLSAYALHKHDHSSRQPVVMNPPKLGPMGQPPEV
jgi:alginate production protein